MTETKYPHIELNADGVPMLCETKIKVIEVVLDRLAHHWDADEIQRQHPHLSLGQIYSCLTYYYDHQTEMDEDIERRIQLAQEIKASLGESPIRLKLKALGKLP